MNQRVWGALGMRWCSFRFLVTQVINVHVAGGYENTAELMEYARTLREPQHAHELRVNVISQKFNFADRRCGRFRSFNVGMSPHVQIAAAKDAVQRASGDMSLDVRCKSDSYWCEHVVAHSNLLPQLVSIFVVHHIDCKVQPQVKSDFFVQLPD